MNQKNKNLLTEVISGLYVLLFIYAAVSKIIDFQKFQVELGKSPILNSISGLVALFIPGAEILISILLIIKRFQYVALYMSFSLMAIFCTYIIAVLKFSIYIPCSCGGILENFTWHQHLLFNIVFLVLASMGILMYPKYELICSKRGILRP